LLLSPTNEVEPLYVPLLSRTLELTTTKINFFAFVGLTKSYYYDIINWNQQEFIKNYDIVMQTNSALITLVDPQLKTAIYETLSQNILKELSTTQLRNYAVIAILGLVLLCLSVVLKMLADIFNLREKSVGIFSEITYKSLQNRSQELTSKLLALANIFNNKPLEQATIQEQDYAESRSYHTSSTTRTKLVYKGTLK
jgi:hypothetical protein